MTQVLGNVNSRCGHNFEPLGCPYPSCGYREVLFDNARLRSALEQCEKERDEASLANARLRAAAQELLDVFLSPGEQMWINDDEWRVSNGYPGEDEGEYWLASIHEALAEAAARKGGE